MSYNDNIHKVLPYELGEDGEGFGWDFEEIESKLEVVNHVFESLRNADQTSTVDLYSMLLRERTEELNDLIKNLSPEWQAEAQRRADKKILREEVVAIEAERAERLSA